MDSVEQTLQTVSAQQEQLNRALMLLAQSGGGKGIAFLPFVSTLFLESDLHRLQTDIAIVKSLLLNQNQFPAIPTTSSSSILNGPHKPIRSVNFAEQIPAWQLGSNDSK